jgi:quinohemoprotein ethanol dehydrogenase
MLGVMTAANVFDRPRLCSGVAFILALTMVGLAWPAPRATHDGGSAVQYLDGSDGRNWPGYGRTFSQQHYSPLTQIDQTTVDRLGLLWQMDLGPDNSATQPIAVDGVLYFATGLSVVHAVDAVNGKRLWQFDPDVARKSGINLRAGWGVRGICWWNGKVYMGTQDGRLIAIDAQSGNPVWSVQTLDEDQVAHVNGAPRVFDGKVIIGYASSTGKSRGYVTTYDAETGRKLWRFYTVPGNPAAGFENRAMKMAATTWAGQWWKFGGGGDVWNAIAYDAESDTVYIGTGSGYPWNRRVRSRDAGDNLFLASIVALEGKTGTYRWHYQTTPGDTWDFDATMDIQLADLTLDGKLRKVLMQAPKNGFFYVLDRLTGELLSASPYAKVTWAKTVDMKTGRPIEVPGARYPNGDATKLWPSPMGAHNWMPMAYSPKAGLVYIPTVEMGIQLSDRGVNLRHWQPPTDRVLDGAVEMQPVSSAAQGELPTSEGTGSLLAWNPITQQPAWQVPHPTQINGGVLATGGDLVFQGTVDGSFVAYSAVDGRKLWSYKTQAPLIATPISYVAKGRQYITLLTGLGMAIVIDGASVWGKQIERYGVNPRSQARRVLTFALDGKGVLPPASPAPLPPLDPEFHADGEGAAAGEVVFERHCAACHGVAAIASIHAPDLRRSAVPLDRQAFETTVRDGKLVSRGMPAFPELNTTQLANMRQYIRTEARRLRDSSASGIQQ